MKSFKTLLLTLCVAALAILANGVPYQTKEAECDDNDQRIVYNQEFLKNANSGYKPSTYNSLNLGIDQPRKLREHYETLKQKADQFVSSSGTNLQDLGVNLNGGSFNKFETGQSQISSSSNVHSSGVNAGIRPPVATNFYNNDGSLLHTVEGLKAQGQGVQFTATGGILPLKNYQDGQVFSQTNGGYGGSYEKHSSSSSQQSSSLNSGLPATLTYGPTEWEKHHQSSSLSVHESTKKRNFTDYSQPEVISHQSNTVVHPLNIAYGAQQAGTFHHGSKTHANYDNSNSASYGVYQVPITVLPILGSNDANYLSETKSQSLSKTLVSSHDSNQGAITVKPIRIQTTPAGIDEMWHKLTQGQTSSQIINNPSGILETSFGTTEADNDELLQTHIRPIPLSTPQNSHYISKEESKHSSSSLSSFQSGQHSTSDSFSSGQSLQKQRENQSQDSSGGKIATNIYVGNPKAPENSGYAITGENKGFYAKSVELANLLSSPFSAVEENQNQNTQQTAQQSSSGSHYDVTSDKSKQTQSGSQSNQQQSGYASTFIEKERIPVITSGGKGFSYEKHQSSNSEYEKTQGSQISGGQGSYSGVPVINEPYKVNGGYNGGYNRESNYDWHTSGGGYGQYGQQKGQWRPASGYGIQTGSGYNSNGQSSNSYQSYQGSSGLQSSFGQGISGAGVACRECSDGVGHQIQYEYGKPVKNSYGLASQFSSSSSNINGQKSESKQASVTINDNGKVDSYHRHNK